MTVINLFDTKRKMYLFTFAFILECLCSGQLTSLSYCYYPTIYYLSPTLFGKNFLESTDEFYLLPQKMKDSNITAPGLPGLPSHDTEPVKFFSFDLKSAKLQVQVKTLVEQH